MGENRDGAGARHTGEQPQPVDPPAAPREVGPPHARNVLDAENHVDPGTASSPVDHAHRPARFCGVQGTRCGERRRPAASRGTHDREDDTPRAPASRSVHACQPRLRPSRPAPTTGGPVDGGTADQGDVDNSASARPADGDPAPTAAPTPWPTDSTTPRTPPQPTDGRKRAPHHWPGPEGGRATAPAGGTTGAVWRAGTGGEGPVRTCSTPRGSMTILRLPSPKGKRYPIRNTRLACRPRHSPQAAPHAQVSRPTRTASATRAPSAAAWVIACAAWRNHRATPCGVPEAYAVSAPR